MKKIIAVLLITVLSLCIAGCDKNDVQDTPDIAVNAPTVTIDPNSINWGYDAVKDEYDRWYLQNTDDVTYIYFENIDAQAPQGSVCIYNLVQSGVVKESAFLYHNGDNHLKSTADSSVVVDFVFQDNFSAYDYTTDSWYSRGDLVSLNAQFQGKEYYEESDNTNTLVFNTDFTCTETVNGIASRGTWELTSKKTLVCTFEKTTYQFSITYDADASVTSIEYGGRVFYTTSTDETTDKYKAY